jgi:hypothetical protein
LAVVAVGLGGWVAGWAWVGTGEQTWAGRSAAVWVQPLG